MRRGKMSEPVVYLDIKDLVRDLEEISSLSSDRITKNVLNDIGGDIVKLAAEKAPVDTGALKQSISYTVNEDRLVIEVKAKYGMFQEFGTASRGEFGGQPYKIKPKNGKYLVFKVKGKTVFAKEVIHPGVKAQPFLRPAVTESLGPLFDKLAERGQASILKGPNSAL